MRTRIELLTLPLNQRTLRVISRGLHQAADILSPDVTIYSDLNLYKEPLPLLCRQCCLSLITYQQWSITPGKNFLIHSRKPLQKHTVNPIPFYRSLKKTFSPPIVQVYWLFHLPLQLVKEMELFTRYLLFSQQPLEI